MRALRSVGPVLVVLAVLIAAAPVRTAFWSARPSIAASPAPWPQFRQDPLHHALGVTNGPQYDAGPKWRAPAGSSVFSSPAIGPDGTPYVGCGDGKLYAFNPDGSQKWSIATDGAVNTSPLIGSVAAQTVIYAGTKGSSINKYPIQAARGRMV